MRHNLATPQHGPLKYPHYTKADDGVVLVVTHPERLIKKDDVVYADKDVNWHYGERKVEKILEHRPARGEHSVDFVPVFQKLKLK